MQKLLIYLTRHSYATFGDKSITDLLPNIVQIATIF